MFAATGPSSEVLRPHGRRSVSVPMQDDDDDLNAQKRAALCVAKLFDGFLLCGEQLAGDAPGGCGRQTCWCQYEFLNV